jgi:hypothetical protein
MTAIIDNQVRATTMWGFVDGTWWQSAWGEGLGTALWCLMMCFLSCLMSYCCRTLLVEPMQRQRRRARRRARAALREETAAAAGGLSEHEIGQLKQKKYSGTPPGPGGGFRSLGSSAVPDDDTNAHTPSVASSSLPYCSVPISADTGTDDVATYDDTDGLASAAVQYECSICLSEFDEGEVLLELRCGHSYHRSCAEKWLSRHNRCPMCNATVVVDIEQPAQPAAVEMVETEMVAVVRGGAGEEVL